MSETAEFTHYCRKWREYRRLSQLDLALLADISQRHLSYLETGKSAPSRDMVLRLCEAMEIPLRERNRLYQAAGYNPKYAESPLQKPDMAPIQQALDRMLGHHDPFPAIVVDRFWNIVQQNQSAKTLFGSLVAALGKAQLSLIDPQNPNQINLALLTLHPLGLRRYMPNWHEVAALFLSRLKSEAMATGDPNVYEYLSKVIEIAGPIETQSTTSSSPLMPALALELEFGDSTLKLFSVISTFGTPQDITTDELRIELFYPADETTRLKLTASEQK